MQGSLLGTSGAFCWCGVGLCARGFYAVCLTTVFVLVMRRSIFLWVLFFPARFSRSLCLDAGAPFHSDRLCAAVLARFFSVSVCIAVRGGTAGAGQRARSQEAGRDGHREYQQRRGPQREAVRTAADVNASSIAVGVMARPLRPGDRRLPAEGPIQVSGWRGGLAA